jgi:hypothetical protein
MTSIKKISGEILLYFYLLQRQDVGKLRDSMLSFGLRHMPTGKEGAQLERRSDSVFKINDFDTYSDNDLYNALEYLYDAGLVDYKDSRDNVGSHFINLKVTAYGVDMVESIERGPEEKRVFNTTFNFNITNDVTVESLLKAEFGSLIKASLL